MSYPLCNAHCAGMESCHLPQYVRVTFTARDGAVSRRYNLCRDCAHRAAVLAGTTGAVHSVTFDNLPALRAPRRAAVRGEGYAVTYH